MAKQKHSRSPAFESIAQGLREAIAFQRGDLAGTVRLHHFERLPDGTVRLDRVEEVTRKEKEETA